MRSSALSKTRTEIDDREGEAPAEPVYGVSAHRLSGSAGASPSHQIAPRFSFDKPRAVELLHRLEIAIAH